jgi:cupin 2 domain-containing protein
LNILKISPDLPIDKEVFETILANQDILIERIISTGQISPPGFWYIQERDEWVLLLQGAAIIAWADGHKTNLKSGDYLMIPAQAKHRVEWTSTEPCCIWLVIHGKLK